MKKRMLFVLAAVVLAILGLYYRSQSSHRAHELAASVVQVDKNSTDPATNANDRAYLKEFVGAHMGASVTYTLQGSYDRAQAAAKASQAAQAGSGNIYADAQKACSGHTDSITQARCNAAYIAAHSSASPSPSPVPEPKLAAYQVSLHAPLWTPDLAGALLLGALAALAMGLLVTGRRTR